MNSLELRKLLIQIHLYLAGFLAPVFLLVAISGGLYLADYKGQTVETPIALAANTQLDFNSPTIKEDVEKLLVANNIDLKFDYIRSRGTTAMTRPTSRTHIKFTNTPNGLIATQVKPNLQSTLIELHKGHGPKIFRSYQILAAIALFLVVLGGLAVGLLSKTYRKATVFSSLIGALLFVILALF